MRRIFTIVALATLLSSTTVSAHEVFRVVGTIVKFEKWRLDVKTADGEMFLIQLQEYTPIQRDKKRVTSKELKAGIGVVVEVCRCHRKNNATSAFRYALEPTASHPGHTIRAA